MIVDIKNIQNCKLSHKIQTTPKLCFENEKQLIFSQNLVINQPTKNDDFLTSIWQGVHTWSTLPPPPLDAITYDFR